MNLDDLAISKHATDKSSKFHGYTKIYQNYLAGFRERRFVLIEIGVATGESLRLWEDFFPNATIVGVDNKEDRKQYETNRIRIEIGDQGDKEFLQYMSQKYAGALVIIDDGGHQMRQQILSFETLFPSLANGGIYVIEDLHTSYIPSIASFTYKGQTTIDFIKKLVDIIHFNGKSIGDWHIGSKELMEKELDGKIFLEPLERQVKSIHLYKSIAFICRA